MSQFRSQRSMYKKIYKEKISYNDKYSVVKGID